MPIDLHCHTKVSDGSTGVDEIIFISRRMGIKNISITDHDTFAGAKRGIVIGNRFGVNVILGVEFSSFIPEMNKEIHILCYMCDYPDRLEGICSSNSRVRKEANIKIVEAVGRSFPINSMMVNLKARGSSGIFKNHIVQSVMDTGYVIPIYSIAYKKIFSLDSVKQIQTHYCSPEEIISKIHQSGGLAILAHPREDDISDVIPKLIGLDIDGLEIHHPSISPNLCDKLEKITKKYDLLEIGGSDFHGMYSIGMRHLNQFTTSDEMIKKMLIRKNEILKRSR